MLLRKQPIYALDVLICQEIPETKYQLDRRNGSGESARAMLPGNKVTVEAAGTPQGVAVSVAPRQTGDARHFGEIFRSVIESSSDAILVTDPGFRILFGNERGLSVLKCGDATGMSAFEFLSREQAARLRKAASRAQETDEGASFRCVFEPADGSQFETDLRITAVRGRNRELQAFFLVMMDRRREAETPGLVALAQSVAHRPWVEEALIESEKRHRIVADTVKEGIATIDESGKILFVNRSVERIFGYTEPEMLGRHLSLLTPGYTRGIPDPGECVGRHKDGHELVLEISFGEFEQGSRTLATGVLRDIGNRRREQEDLRQANETLRALIEATPLAIVAIDARGRISKWNSAAEKMFGFSKAEAIGQSLPAAAEGQSLLLREAVEQATAITVETKRKRKDGTLVEVSISAAPLAGPDGAPAGAVAVITDITARKRLEDQLRQAQKMEAVGRLAGGIAHDFNNLLTVIVGYGDILTQGLEPGSLAASRALEIVNAAEKAAALTKQLLAVSRLQVSHPKLLDINPIVQNMSNMLRRLIGEDIELSLALDPALGTVRCDPNQIEQVLVNLVVNARDAMPDGGRITIETGSVELGEKDTDRYFDIKPGRYVFISVADTGHGMTQQMLGYIFEPFFTTKGVGKGTGVGLSRVYGNVKQNHGSIQVRSEPGKGSTFKVYLPAVAESPQEREPEGFPALPCGNETVLLVEDEAGLREMAQELLCRQGYTVLTASSCDEALEVCALHPGPIHLLLTDVVMPKGSGQELARRMRELHRGERVIFMSGYPSETVLSHGAFEPGVGFLEKPFTAETLTKKVRSTLDEPVGVPNR